MSVMERAVTETSLPIYHHSIDWDALYKRYPVPDVFAKTRWKWSADEIRAFQNEQFLDLMKVGWRNGFYQRRWKTAGIEPGDVRSIDDIVKLPMFDSADIKKDQEENHGNHQHWHTTPLTPFCPADELASVTAVTGGCELGGEERQGGSPDPASAKELPAQPRAIGYRLASMATARGKRMLFSR